MPSLLSRRNVLKASMGLAVAGLSGVAGRLAGRLGLPMAASGAGRRVLTEDLRLNAGELAAGSSSGTKVAGGRLTLAASGTGEYVSPGLRSSFPATHAGLHWRGSSPQSASFWLRSSPDGQAWSEWQPVIVEAGHGREPLPETYGALIRVDRAQQFQFRARLDGGNGKAEIQSVTVTVLNAEDETLALPLAAPSAKPLTYSREAWGADEGLRFKSSGEVWPRDYLPTKKAVVHHTATGNDYPSPAAAMADVRAIYTYHASTLGWGDIGYSWIIDKFGNAYEGRRGRDGPGYDGPGGRELVSEGVVGGHVRSYNHGSTGIALLGTFQSVAPSSEALSKLGDVLAWECSQHGINPQASTDFLTASDNWHRALPNVCGHRDTVATACPGSSLYALLPGLRNDVASRLADPSAPTVSMISAPGEATRTDRNVGYAWQSDGGSGAKEYSYYLEGWSLNDDILVVYESGFNAAREPAWSSWTAAREASFTLSQPGHYTFHVRARDSLGRVSVYEDSRTLLAVIVPTRVAMSLDAPGDGATVQQPFRVAGWAIDRAAPSGTGVDAVHVYVYPADGSGAPTGASPVFLGVALYGGSRPDVAGLFGEQVRDCGYQMEATGLGRGTYKLVVYARSTMTGMWQEVQRTIEVPSPIMSLDAPGAGATVQQPFRVAGWAIDRGAPSGTGVDAVHVYAYPADGSGAPTGASPVFLGAALYGASRPDVAGLNGEHF
ncbi:MAG: N-acetylmuramoyl-L-alanine amidase, partial [Dehalococcoidia bacterium]